jgi:stage II sporulation protein E
MKIKTKDNYPEINEDFYGIESEEKNKSSAYYLRFAVFAFAGFCFSQLEALGNMSPFTVSFLSAINFDYCFGTFVASSLGYFLSKNWQSALKYTISSFLICLVRLFINRRLAHKDFGKVNYISSFLCPAITSIIFISTTTFNYINLFMVICESCLSLCACIFFIRTRKTPVFKTGISALGVKDSASLVLSLCIFLMCMSGFSIEGLSPARILSCIALMFISFYKGSAAGSVAGICIGASLCIDSNFRYLFPGYALSGLVSGVCSPMGQIVTALSFGISYTLVSLTDGTGSNVIISLSEVAISACAFMIVPSKWITHLGDTLKKSGIAPDNPISRQVSENLHSAAENIYQVSDIIGKVSNKLDSIINPEVNRLFANLQQSVCVGCENKSRCWNKMFDSTASDILAISGIEKRSKGKLPLEKRCIRQDILIKGIEDNYFEYANNMAVKMKIREMRKVLTDQFSCMGDFLSETADKISGSKQEDTTRSVSLRTVLQNSGIYTDALSYYTDKDGRVTIEISIIDRPFETDRKKLKHIIEFISKRRFGDADITVGDVKTTITFQEKYLYDVQFGYSQKPLNQKGFCGDSVCFISCHEGTKTALISDGMGTGYQATNDSGITSRVMKRLICSGFSFDSALKIVNSALIARSAQESVASIDAVEVNLFTGETFFYKAGAACSIIRKRERTVTLERSSMPLGIIRNIGFSKTRFTGEAGDIILLLSDGVTQTDHGWINDELLSWSTNSMEELSRHILRLASLRRDRATADDMTVVAVKIEKNGL